MKYKEETEMSQMWFYTSIIPALERKRRGGWNGLGQPGILRTCLKRTMRAGRPLSRVSVCHAGMRARVRKLRIHGNGREEWEPACDLSPGGQR